MNTNQAKDRIEGRQGKARRVAGKISSENVWSNEGKQGQCSRCRSGGEVIRKKHSLPLTCLLYTSRCV